MRYDRLAHLDRGDDFDGGGAWERECVCVYVCVNVYRARGVRVRHVTRDSGDHDFVSPCVSPHGRGRLRATPPPAPPSPLGCFWDFEKDILYERSFYLARTD